MTDAHDAERQKPNFDRVLEIERKIFEATWTIPSPTVWKRLPACLPFTCRWRVRSVAEILPGS